MIYLDNSATTKPDPSVLETFNKVSTNYFANPSSLHNLGAESEQFYDKVKSQVARLLKCETNEVIFTSGGTESNNLAIKGIANYYKNRGNHIITTEIEHASVYKACEQLEENGFEVTYLKVDNDGIIDLEELKQAIKKSTILVSIMHVNNEIGSIQPIEEIAAILKDHKKIMFHTDAVQSFGKLPINLDGIDLLSISGHKLNGLRGTGVLYVKKGVQIDPLFVGGEQEFNLRSGTENLAGNASLARAMRLALEKYKEVEKLKQLKEGLKDALKKMPHIFVNTPEKSSPHIIHFSVPGINSETLIHALAKRDIFVSTQSACSSKSDKISRVLLAVKHDEEIASSGIRVSLSYETTQAELNTFITVLKEEINKIREVLR